MADGRLSQAGQGGILPQREKQMRSFVSWGSMTDSMVSPLLVFPLLLGRKAKKMETLYERGLFLDLFFIYDAKVENKRKQQNQVFSPLFTACRRKIAFIFLRKLGLL